MCVLAAARNGNLEALESADHELIDSQDKLQRTPLYLAAWAGQQEVCYHRGLDELQ